VHEAETYREQSIRSWDSVASAWERHRDVTQRACLELNAWLLDRLAPSAGQTIMDLASGPGDMGLEVARRLQGNGRVLLVDQSPAMLDSARRGAQQVGLADMVDTAAMDAERLDLADGSVDGAVCRFGYMLMPDPGAALAETRRVLSPGGRLAFAVWAEAAENPWALVIGPVLTERGAMPPPDPSQPGMFVLADEARLRELVTAAGFAEVEIARVAVHWPYGEFDTYWEIATAMSPAMSAALAAAGGREAAEVHRIAQQRYAAAQDADGTLPGLTFAVFAR
jgi:ubiquinone/menaquinone biosynthesis C-methylase UbiE